MNKNYHGCSNKLQEMVRLEDFSLISMLDFNDNFVPTGSRVFGGALLGTDHDFLVYPDQKRAAFAICAFFKADREEYYSDQLYSYTFNIKKGITKVNLIIFKEDYLFPAWCFATHQMKQLWDLGNPDYCKLIQNKENRCAMFELLAKMYLDLGYRDVL